MGTRIETEDNEEDAAGGYHRLHMERVTGEYQGGDQGELFHLTPERFTV